MKKIILCHLLLTSYVFASQSPQTELGDSYHPIFKGHRASQIQKILDAENIIPVPIANGLDVGFNMPIIAAPQEQILKTCASQTIIEFGPGSGYFMGKLLAAGASRVTGIEISTPASMQIPQTIKTYEPYLGAFQGKFAVINKNVCEDKFAVIKNLNKQYDQIVGMNFLHYLTPMESILFLNSLKPIMKENTTLTFSMNTPAGHQSTCDAYKKAKEDLNNKFPGYIKRTRVDTQLYQTNNNQLSKFLGKIGTEWVAAQPFKFTENLSPSKLNVAEPHIEFRKDQTAKLTVSLEQTMFAWDKQTAIYTFGKAGLAINDMYYLDDNGTRHEEVDLTNEQDTVFNLVVVASPK